MKFSVFNPTIDAAGADARQSRRLVYRDHHDLSAARLAPGSHRVSAAVEHDDALSLNGDHCSFLRIQSVSGAINL
jgi:hypothetical protein